MMNEGGRRARMSRGVHVVVEVLRAVGAVVAGLAALGVVISLVAVCEGAWPERFVEGGVVEISTGVMGTLLGAILCGMAAAAIARPRYWLGAGLAPALLLVVAGIWLAPGMPLPAGVDAAIIPLRMTLASVTLLLGGALGGALVRALRARKARTVAVRLSAPES